jgi:hypothetical protein
LRLIHHFQSVIEGVSKKFRRSRAAPKVACAEKFYADLAILSRGEDAGGQFKLNGTIHHSVGRYNVKIDKWGTVGVRIGWWGGAFDFVGRAGH